MIEENKECLHYWEWGWLGDYMIFCTKCNKDADDIYSKEDFNYATHTCKDGRLVTKEIKNEKKVYKFFGGR